jgi:Protein of unknown function (DUF751)
MYTFWDNVSKFPRFIISVFMGFFLTTVYPFFRLLTNKKNNYFIGALIIIFFGNMYIILKLMLGYAYL